MITPSTLDSPEAIASVILQQYGRRVDVRKDIDSTKKLEILRSVSVLRDHVWLVEQSAQSAELFAQLKIGWLHYCLVANGRIQTLSSRPPRSQIEHILDPPDDQCGVCKNTLIQKSARACVSCNFKTCAPCGMKEAIDAYTAKDRVDHCPNPTCSYTFQISDPQVSFCYLSQVWHDICSEKEKGLSDAEAEEVLQYGKEKIKKADPDYYWPFATLIEHPEHLVSVDNVLKILGRLK